MRDLSLGAPMGCRLARLRAFARAMTGGSAHGWLDRAIALGNPKLLPARPGPRLEIETDGVWSSTRTFGARFAPQIPARMAVVRLASGGLCVWSPLEADPELCREIAALGPIDAVLAPSTFHHRFAADFCAATSPRALFVAPGLREKNPALASGRGLDAAAEPAFGGELHFTTIGPLGAFCEVLCFHEPTGTLFVADLGFHFVNLPRRIDRWFWRAYGSYGAFGPSLLVRTFLRRDRSAVARALAVAVEWPIQRIFVAHGTSVVEDASARFRAAFEPWL